MMGIVLTRFQKKLGYDDLFDALRSQDISQISLDDAAALKSILPSSQEYKDAEWFRSRQPNYEQDAKVKINPPEAFVLKALDEPNLEYIVDAFIFHFQYESETQKLVDSFKRIRNACEQLRSDDNIKSLFGLILQVGNLMNYEYGNSARGFQRNASGAAGFRIQSLTRLKDVKSKDGKVTLMHFLIELIENQTPELLDLPEKYQELHELRHLNTNELTHQQRELRLNYDRLLNYKPKKCDRFAVFKAEVIAPLLEKVFEQLQKVDDEVNAMKAAWNDLAGYFGEEMDETGAFTSRPEEVFNTLDFFFHLMKDTAIQYRKEQERIAKQNDIQASTSTAGPPPPRPLPSPSPLSLRDQLLQDIRDRAKVMMPIATEPAEVAREKISGKSQECSECGLPIAECDCCF